MSMPPPTPPPDTLVAFIMTRKASNTSFLYTQAGTDGHSAMIFEPMLVSYIHTARMICKYNTLPHHDTLLPVV